LDVRLEEETVWLSQAQISDLFGIERSVTTKHLRNIFKDEELHSDAVCAIFAHTASDGKDYKIKSYNLDAIISVGYRVNSKQATQFRVWATKTLKDHLIKGYTINEKRFLEAREKFNELQTVISFLQEKSKKELSKVFTSHLAEKNCIHQ